MKVARSEAQLLDLTQGLFESRAQPWLRTSNTLPKKISPAAMDHLKQLLGVGCVRTLVGGGGWRDESRPVNGAVKQGRLWERHPLPPLAFSPWSYRLLRHLLTTTNKSALAGPTTPTLGDRVLAFVAAKSLHAAQLPLDSVTFEPLVQVGWHLPIDPSLLVQDLWLFEAVQHDLCTQWVAHLKRMGQQRSPTELTQICDQVRTCLNGFLDIVEPLDRRDLADFIVDAACAWIPADPTWMPALNLDPDTSLRDRTTATRAMSVFPELLLRLARGIHADGAVNFFEPEYDASQLRLRRWERLGDPRIYAARNAVERLSS